MIRKPVSPARASLAISLAVSLATLAAASDASAQATPLIDTNPLRHAYAFDDGSGAHTAYDSIGGMNGTGGADALWLTGETPALGAAHDKLVFMYPSTGYDDPNAFVDFGNAVGAFGSDDFTVMHWFVTSYNVPGTLGDVVGNRTSYSHGNFFAVRMRGDGIISVELDQDAAGTNYVGIVGEHYPVNDSKLHHLAYVRQGRALTLYIDGILIAAAETASGQPTFISGADSFRIGRRAPFAFTSIPGFYDDLKIYNVALSPQQIQSAMAGTL